MWCQLPPAAAGLKLYGRALWAWVCGINHHHVHTEAGQKKFTFKDQKKTTSFTAQHTCIQAGRTTYCTEQHGPATLLYLTHTNLPAHMPFISTVFKVPRTGNHYESMLLTATLRDEKLCLTLLLHCSLNPKNPLKIGWRIQITYIKG